MNQYLDDELKAWSTRISKQSLSGKDAAGRALIQVLVSTFINRWKEANCVIACSEREIEEAKSIKNTISELVNYLVNNHGIDKSEIAENLIDVHEFNEITEMASGERPA